MQEVALEFGLVKMKGIRKLPNLNVNYGNSCYLGEELDFKRQINSRNWKPFATDWKLHKKC